MPSLPNREILRAILSNPTAVRVERHRRRVPTGTDGDLLAFVEETFGVRNSCGGLLPRARGAGAGLL